MKKNRVLSFLLLCSLFSHAQPFSDLKQVNLRNAETCRLYNGQALACARYILSTPHQSPDSSRTQAMQFLISWMSATPDYHFQLDERVGKLNPRRESLLGEYMAGMASYCLENSGPGPDPDSIALEGWHRLAQYCANENHAVRITRAIRRLINSDAEGRLKNYARK